MKRSPLRKVSKKRVSINREYSELRKQFLLLNPYCEWWILENEANRNDIAHYQGGCWCKGHIWRIAPRATDIHHKKGRARFLLDTSTWMAVSRQGHDAIHANPKESYEKGYMLPRR